MHQETIGEKITQGARKSPSIANAMVSCFPVLCARDVARLSFDSLLPKVSSVCFTVIDFMFVILCFERLSEGAGWCGGEPMDSAALASLVTGSHRRGW